MTSDSMSARPRIIGVKSLSDGVRVARDALERGRSGAALAERAAEGRDADGEAGARGRRELVDVGRVRASASWANAVTRSGARARRAKRDQEPSSSWASLLMPLCSSSFGWLAVPGFGERGEIVELVAVQWRLSDLRDVDRHRDVDGRQQCRTRGSARPRRAMPSSMTGTGTSRRDQAGEDRRRPGGRRSCWPSDACESDTGRARWLMSSIGEHQRREPADRAEEVLEVGEAVLLHAVDVGREEDRRPPAPPWC